MVERLEGYASGQGHTLVELALGWLVGNPQVASVIAGATRPEQVRANVAAAQAWALSEAQRAEVDAVIGVAA